VLCARWDTACAGCVVCEVGHGMCWLCCVRGGTRHVLVVLCARWDTACAGCVVCEVGHGMCWLCCVREGGGERTPEDTRSAADGAYARVVDARPLGHGRLALPDGHLEAGFQQDT
jgi:hypothetical protein